MAENCIDALTRRLRASRLNVSRWITSKTPDWITLRTFGQNKLLKSSYFWFFLVPICAKLLQHLPDPVSIVLPNVLRSPNELELVTKEVTLSLSLPFTWQIMFFASVTFSIASIIFAWRCPRLIRDFVNPADFTAQGRVPFHIWHFVGETREDELPPNLVSEGYILSEDPSWEKREKTYRHGEDAMKRFWTTHVPIDTEFNLKCMNEYYEAQERPYDMEDEYHLPDTPWHKPISDEHFKLLFHGARLEMQTMHFWSRLLCAIFYAIGFLAIIYLAYENVRSVWNITMR